MTTQIHTADRLDNIGEYYFSQKLREIESLNKAGKNVINLGIGSPDLPPHPGVIETLNQSALQSGNHAYQSYKGSLILREAIAGWYHRYYDVQLDANTEVLPLIGSKEGIMHICMTYLNEGDKALIPNPGYPTYSSVVKLAGGRPVAYELCDENDWQPDFDKIESQNLDNVKLMWVNYPHMPSGRLPAAHTFEKLIQFGKKHNILICHDNPYSFIQSGKPQSILSVEGAKDCAIELNSLSKSHNMAGWRVGMICGAKERIEEVLRFKSNMDSGMFLPVQLAAATALNLPQDWYEHLNAVYQQRKLLAYEIMDAIGCEYHNKQAGLFLWGKIDKAWNNHMSGFELSDKILHQTNVFITPGGIFGSAGNQYMRLSLCSTEEKLSEALQRIKTQFWPAEIQQTL